MIFTSTDVETIARALLGEPNKAQSTKTEWRYGEHGALAIQLKGKKAGLWFDHARNEGGGLLDLVQREKGLDVGGAFDWLRSIGIAVPERDNGKQQRRVVIAEYLYRTTDGAPLFKVLKWNTGPRFTQQRYDAATGKFVGGKGCMSSVDRVPYHLDELTKASGLVAIVEGEKDADNVRALGLTATCNAGGAGKWPKGYVAYFRADQHVVILPDNDDPGRRHARDVAGSLLSVPGAVASVRILELPDLPAKGDVSDWIAAGGTADQLRALIETAPSAQDWLGQQPVEAEPEDEAEPEAAPDPEGNDDPDDPRPRLELTARRFNLVVRACAHGMSDIVYMRGSIPRVLARAEVAGGRLIEDRDGEAIEIEGVRYRPGSLLFIEAMSELIGWHLDERFTFWKYDQRSRNWVAVTCPAKVAARLVDAAIELGLRPCSGFVQVPLFIDGEIISTPGWHAPTRLIIDLPHTLDPIPGKPTKDDAQAALTTLLTPFRGYLQDNPDLRPAIAAAALTSVLRPSLRSAPAILVDGNIIGAGKSLLARALGALNMGGVPAMIVEGPNGEETEKRVATSVLQGAPAILFDNLQRTVGSSTLESMLTADGVATIRLFGSLTDVTVECRAFVLLTANNATLRRDMLRRTLPIRIVALDDKPELRRFGFNPITETHRDRGKLLTAAFTIAKAWHSAGDHSDHTHIRNKTLGSFEPWADLVAGAVHWLTGTSPIDAIEERKGEDPAAIAERMLIGSLFETYQNLSFLAADAAKKISKRFVARSSHFQGRTPRRTRRRKLAPTPPRSNLQHQAKWRKSAIYRHPQDRPARPGQLHPLGTRGR